MDALFTILPKLINLFLPLLPFIAGLVRWNKMDPGYKPLILIFGCAYLAEQYRFLQVINFNYKLGWPLPLSFLGYNLYILIISILYPIWFSKQGDFRKYPWILYLLIFLMVAGWTTDHFFIPGNDLFKPTKYFRIFYSFILCMLAIQHLNILLVTERKSLLKNSSFLVCIAILLFFLPYVLTESATFFIYNTSKSFSDSVYNYRRISLFFIYTIYTLAVLWAPPKKKFIQLS